MFVCAKAEGSGSGVGPPGVGDVNGVAIATPPGGGVFDVRVMLGGGTVVGRGSGAGAGRSYGVGCASGVCRGGGNCVPGGNVGRPSGLGRPSFVVPIAPL